MDFASKSNIVDADLVAGFDSATNFSKIKTTWTSIKAFLKSYFDTLYNGIIKTGQSAPTTSTVGYLGQVIFDAAGNRWELKRIDGTTYYWSPDGFPADNVAYPAYVENGVMVWKIRVPGTSGANINVSFSSPAVGAKKILKTEGGLWLASGGFCPFPIYNFSGTFQFTVVFNINDVTGIMSYTIWTGYHSSFYNRPIFTDFYFTK